MKTVHYRVLTLIYLSLATLSSCQENPPHQATTQFPVGYPTLEGTALQQLKTYPIPRYLPGNHLQRLFNWMDPEYMGGQGQGLPKKVYHQNAVMLVDELAHNWNYGIISSIVNGTLDGIAINDTICPEMIKLANENPQIPFDVITYWLQPKPSDMGYKDRTAEVRKSNYDSVYYRTFDFYGKQKREISFNFPDSLIRIDGEAKAFTFRKMVKFLKRPINRINENGEEPPGAYQIRTIAGDPVMKKMKDSMKIDSWDDFMAIRKLDMRNTYSSAFLKDIPELNSTFFNFYTVEGGPIDRFKWSIMKKSMTPLNGIYYSTPDFYPRWPKNWKDWTGAWHGWRWIETGRKTEIKEGDYLFSPYVAAGWSNNYTDNISPGQWLGLLKCLSVVGAEFYYVGYFNEKKPFSNPSDYAWQAAIPAYAQAVTSRFEDVLKDGNVLFEANKQPIISYPTDDKHVLITARESNNKEKYVICGTYQPFSNDSDEIPESKIVNTTINGHNLTFEARRQGSVYIYEKTPDNRTIFYQLDKWHQNAHPDKWSKDFYFEAEVADSGVTSFDIYTDKTGYDGDYTNYTSYIHLDKNKKAVYAFCDRDTLKHNLFIWVRYKGNGKILIYLKNETSLGSINNYNTPPKTWAWIKIPVTSPYLSTGNTLVRISTSNGEIDLDKFVITTNGEKPPTY